MLSAIPTRGGWLASKSFPQIPQMTQVLEVLPQDSRNGGKKPATTHYILLQNAETVLSFKKYPFHYPFTSQNLQKSSATRFTLI